MKHLVVFILALICFPASAETCLDTVKEGEYIYITEEGKLHGRKLQNTTVDDPYEIFFHDFKDPNISDHFFYEDDTGAIVIIPILEGDNTCENYLAHPEWMQIF